MPDQADVPDVIGFVDSHERGLPNIRGELAESGSYHNWTGTKRGSGRPNRLSQGIRYHANALLHSRASMITGAVGLSRRDREEARANVLSATRH